METEIQKLIIFLLLFSRAEVACFGSLPVSLTPAQPGAGSHQPPRGTPEGPRRTVGPGAGPLWASPGGGVSRHTLHHRRYEPPAANPPYPIGQHRRRVHARASDVIWGRAVIGCQPAGSRPVRLCGPGRRPSAPRLHCGSLAPLNGSRHSLLWHPGLRHLSRSCSPSANPRQLL